MKKIISYFATFLTSLTAFANSGRDINIGDVADSLNTQINSFGNLIVVLMMVLGFFCLYKIVMTFMNRDDERAYPMKNLPMYFAGAAIGLGSSMASDVVQSTLFGQRNSNLDTGNYFDLSE